MTKKKAVKKTSKKKNAQWVKPKEQVRPRVLKPSIGPKRAMELLVDAFKEARQRPPHMRAYKEDPSAAFLIDTYALIAEWPPQILRDFLAETTNAPNDGGIPGLIGQVKRVLHDIFDVDEVDSTIHTARWKMWPYRADSEESEAKLNKRATKRKKTPSKRAAPKDNEEVKQPVVKRGKEEKKTSRASLGLTENDIVRANPKMRDPNWPDRLAIKKDAGAGKKIGAIVKKLGCTVKTIEAMVKKGFLEVVK